MNDGRKISVSFKQLIEEFKKPDRKYAPYEFWFFDQDLNTLGIKPQDMARELCERGFNPGYAHGRLNLAQVCGKLGEHVRPMPSEQWLSEKWLEEFEKIVLQATADGTHFSFADEYGWPSLQACGRVLRTHPELSSKRLAYTYTDVAAGKSVRLPAAYITVAGKVEQTELTHFVEYIPVVNDDDTDSDKAWARKAFYNDRTDPWHETPVVPYNFSVTYTEAGDGSKKAIWHPFFKHAGCYRVYAYWYDVQGNATNAVYHIGEETVTVDQSVAANRWNLLGEFNFEQGRGSEIWIDDCADGRVVVDAIKFVSCTDKNDYIVIDDWHTTDREIAVLDSATLTELQQKKDGITFSAPKNSAYRVYSFTIEENQRAYDGSMVDNMNPILADTFLDIAYKPYMERFSEYMGPGKAVNGVFNDHEGGYGYKLVWSPSVETLFEQKTGRKLGTYLPLLIDRDLQGFDAVVRHAWYDTVSDLYTENIGRVSRYAEEHGLYYTMHTWEESLQLQAGCVGDYFKMSRAVTLPGTDALVDVSCNPMTFKDAQSVAEFDGKRLMNEVAALMSLRQYTPEEIKRQANFLAAYGVSHVITHALKMTRQYAQEVVIPDFYNIDPSWRYMDEWSGFVRRTSYINSLGRVKADVLLLNPMDTVWALAEGDVFDADRYPVWDCNGGIPKSMSAFGGEVAEINRCYEQTVHSLTRNRIEFLTADRYYTERMQLSKNKLCYGDMVFGTVILPRMKMIGLDTAKKLLDFAKAGGILYYIGTFPSDSIQNGRSDPQIKAIATELLKLPNVYKTENIAQMIEERYPGLRATVCFADGEFDLLTHRREIDGKTVIFLANNHPEVQKCRIRIEGATGNVHQLDPTRGTSCIIPSETQANALSVALAFEPYEAYYIVIDPNDSSQPEHKSNVLWREEIKNGWKAWLETGNRETQKKHVFEPVETDKLRLVLRKGAFEHTEKVYIQQIRLYNNGNPIEYTAVASSGGDVGAVADGNTDTIWQNEHLIFFDEPEWIELSFEKQCVDAVEIISPADEPLTSYRLEYKDGKLWKNIITFNSYIQPEIVRPVAWPNGLISEKKSVELIPWDSWNCLPDNFCGLIDYECDFTVQNADKIYLELETVSGGAEVWINGALAGHRLFAPFIWDITPWLNEGKNTIHLRVANTVGCNVGNSTGGVTNVVVYGVG